MCKFNIRRGYTEGPDGLLVLPESLKILLLEELHSATHHGTEKYDLNYEEVLVGDCIKVAKLVYDQCLIDQTPNPGRP